jgi:hypothetical protein
MPRGDRTGSRSQGPMTARGRGGRVGRDRGGNFGAGPCGDCVCLGCGFKLAHERGVQCFQMRCPKCGAMMSRERLTALNE